MKKSFILTIALFLCLATPLFAVDNSIGGTVTAGPRTTLIANARVSLRGNGHEYNAQTDDSGNYTIPALEADVPYTLSIQAGGLRPFEKAGIVLRAGEATRWMPPSSWRTSGSPWWWTAASSTCRPRRRRSARRSPRPS